MHHFFITHCCQLGTPQRCGTLALAAVPLVPVVGGEGDVVGVDGSVGTDVTHVAGGVERREVRPLLLLLLLKSK